MAADMRRWRIGRDVAFEFVDDEAVALNLKTGAYYRLNPTAARAWRLLEKSLGMDALVDDLLEEMEVERGRLEADLAELFADLERHGLAIRET